MDYEKMTKEELIEFIRECEKKRAFTYEDQMKLEFVDGSPFTIWASDRDCKIRFWAGECEELYGYKKEEVLGKDFVDLFVAEDEKKTAREDQISIIDSGAIFHNIANDIGKKGNTLRLLTNCWRMKPLGLDEYWNFEMGLIVDFYNQEVERLNQVVSESRLLKDHVTRFVDSSHRYRDQFIERRRYLMNALKQCKSAAVKQKRRREFEAGETDIRTRVNDVRTHIESLIEEYAEKINMSNSAEESEGILQEFMLRCDDEIDAFEDAVICFQEISMDYEGAGSTEVGKSTLVKDIEPGFTDLQNRANELISKIDREINLYSVRGSINGEISAPKTLTFEREMLDTLLNQMREMETNIRKRISDVKSDEELDNVRNEAESLLKNFNGQVEVRAKSVAKNIGKHFS